MKNIYLLLAIILLSSCSNLKVTDNQWIGKTKQDVVKTLGIPIRVFENTPDGQTLFYADQFYDQLKRNDLRQAGVIYWKYTFIKIDKTGKVSSLRNEKQNYPPQSIDSDKIAQMNL